MKEQNKKKLNNNSKNCISQVEYNELRKLLQENLSYNKRLLEYTKDMHNFLFWSKVTNILRIAVIIIPFIVAYFYFIPFIQEKYQKLFDLINNIAL